MTEDYTAKAKELCASGRMYLRDESYQRSIAHHPKQCAFCPIIESALIAADKAGCKRTNKRWNDATVSTIEQWRGERVDAVWLGDTIRSRAEKGGEGR